ncbi:MAG: hypothetical protein J7M32_00620 [Deltaproteobacteria bacterium]|nr:hypothetical protein [Deltaproteobacteria bacterium]
MEQINRRDHLLEISKVPLARYVHGLLNAGKADHPFHPVDPAQGVAEAFDLIESVRVKNIPCCGHNQDNFLAPEALFNLLVCQALGEILNGEIVDGGLKSEVRQVCSKKRRDHADYKDNPTGMVYYIPKAELRACSFREMRHWYIPARKNLIGHGGGLSRPPERMG